jgi:hypothetical protein
LELVFLNFAPTAATHIASPTAPCKTQGNDNC